MKKLNQFMALRLRGYVGCIAYLNGDELCIEDFEELKLVCVDDMIFDLSSDDDMPSMAIH